jgi:hypothetical protein
MQRRDFVKAMLAASVSARAMLGQQNAPTNAPTAVPPSTPPPTLAKPTPPAGPVPWMRGLMEAKPLPMTPLVPDAVAATETRFFSPDQFATLRQLCEVMMPPWKDSPGALDAGTPEFLDFLISVSSADRQKMYRDGLDRLNAEARKKFGVPFAGVTAEQADALIRPHVYSWMTDHPPTDPYDRFITLANSDIRTATVNSKPWIDSLPAEDNRMAAEGLYWFPVDPDMKRDEYGKC